MDHLPLIDLRAAPDEVARAIGDACRRTASSTSSATASIRRSGRASRT
jgi:hypothetical protein